MGTLIPSLHHHFAGRGPFLKWHVVIEVEESRALLYPIFCIQQIRVFLVKNVMSVSAFCSCVPRSTARAKTNQPILDSWHVSSWMTYQVILPLILWCIVIYWGLGYYPHYLKRPLHRLDNLFLYCHATSGAGKFQQKNSTAIIPLKRLPNWIISPK